MLSPLSAKLLRRLLLVSTAAVSACNRSPSGEGNPTSGNAYPSPPTPTGPACGQDEVKEWLCGNTSVTPPGCGISGAQLTAFGPAHLTVTEQWGPPNDARFAPLHYDEGATETYRKTVGPSPTPLRNYCCYSGCTHLEVAASASREVPAGQLETERCIDAPGGGTSQPASVSQCPQAVKLEGQMRPFAGGNAKSCCYVIPRPPPPVEPQHAKGRPLNVRGELRVASLSKARTTHW